MPKREIEDYVIYSISLDEMLSQIKGKQLFYMLLNLLGYSAYSIAAIEGCSKQNINEILNTAKRNIRDSVKQN